MRQRHERDWTKGSIIRNLVLLTWPIIATQGVGRISSVVDMFWVAKLGAASIAGVGVSALAVQLATAFIMGLGTGMRAMIARFTGAGDTAGANHVARQAFVVAAGFALIMAIIGIFFADLLLIHFGMPADTVAAGAPYLRIMFVGSATMAFLQIMEGTMQASGDAITPLKINIFFRLIHVGLAPFLIFGWWVFPRLGTKGAALSNIIAESLGLALASWILFTGRTRLRLTLRNFRLDTSIIGRIVRIGLPASVTQMERIFAQLVLTRIVVLFGTFAIAARSLLRVVETPLVSMPTLAMGRGAGVLAAQNLGAGQPERAERTGWQAVALTEGFVASISVVLWLGAERVFAIFTPTPDVVEIASTLLRIAIVGYLALGFAHVLQSCISEVGDTLPPMLFTLLGQWGVQVPLGYFLAKAVNLGVYGIEWGIVIGMCVRTVAVLVYFRSGRWKHKKV